MVITLSATFDTRREAEMTVERLVQQFELDRTAIVISAEEDENSAGEAKAGSGIEAGEPSAETRDHAPSNGAVVVTFKVSDENTADKVRDAFGEFDADCVVETDLAVK